MSALLQGGALCFFKACRSGVYGALQPNFKKLLQMLVAQAFFFFGKMHLPELFRGVLIAEFLIPELFTGKVKGAAAHDIEAVIISVGPSDAVHLPPEDILGKKGGYGALTESFVPFAPPVPHTRGAGVGAPYAAQGIIQVTGGLYPREVPAHCLHICAFTAVKSVSVHSISFR